MYLLAPIRSPAAPPAHWHVPLPQSPAATYHRAFAAEGGHRQVVSVTQKNTTIKNISPNSQGHSWGQKTTAPPLAATLAVPLQLGWQLLAALLLWTEKKDRKGVREKNTRNYNNQKDINTTTKKYHFLLPKILALLLTMMVEKRLRRRSGGQRETKRRSRKHRNVAELTFYRLYLVCCCCVFFKATAGLLISETLGVRQPK